MAVSKDFHFLSPHFLSDLTKNEVTKNEQLGADDVTVAF